MQKARIRLKERERIRRFMSLSLKTLSLLLWSAKLRMIPSTTKEVGHWKRNCPVYLAELIKKKKQVGTASSSNVFIIELFSFPTKSWVYDTICGTYICNTKHGLGGVRKLKQVEAIGSFDLVLTNDLGPVDLEEIQEEEDTTPSEITSKIPQEVEEVEEYGLGDLNEPTRYKAAMLDSESNKWIDAMNAEIQSMMDNMVWVLVDLPHGCKTVGSKWLFKKKTDMDGIIHVYKSRLVAKGYTQLYGVDYEETFSPVADIRAIRIPISILVGIN
ncbi:putative retrotransposon ty1-copia subclass protein [Tanacetum coccineum]